MPVQMERGAVFLDAVGEPCAGDREYRRFQTRDFGAAGGFTEAQDDAVAVFGLFQRRELRVGGVDLEERSLASGMRRFTGSRRTLPVL